VGLGATYGRAVAAHRQARIHLDTARRLLATAPGAVDTGEVADLVARLHRAGTELSGEPDPARFSAGPVPIRLGAAATADGEFPVVVPLAGGTHLAIDADGREPTVAALLRTLLVRLLAAAPVGAVRVSALDPAALGGTFLPLHPLVEAGVMVAPATTDAEIATLLDDAEQHVRAVQRDLRTGRDDPRELLVVVAATAPAGRDLARLAALTHAGPAASVCVLLAGYPVDGPQPVPPLGATTGIRLGPDGYARVGDPPGYPFSPDGTGLAVPVRLDGDLPPAAIGMLARRFSEVLRREETFGFADLLPERPWSESSASGLRTVVGRAGGDPATLAFDDATPHWLIGGRTGAGKTVFLLDVLYGLAARYAPDQLALYLLDFKEGVSFTEFVPTGRDPSWLPHARAVGIESDREYGVAVLRELKRELSRRAATFKRHGVTKLADLPAVGAAVPRVVVVIDEFHVLLAGNDAIAREAVTLLEELARKGRSYGIHLVLASQSTSGIEALYGKADAIFGQFPLRVALPGGSGVLDTLNDAADGLPIGSAVINPAAGLATANTVIRFPDAHAHSGQLARLRHKLWQARAADARPPAVFRGYESVHVADDPTYQALAPTTDRPLMLVGRTVDVALSSASFGLDSTPGRHLAVVGTSGVGADVLHAVTLGLARQHAPGTARFLLAPLVATADEVVAQTASALIDAGHPVRRLDAAALREEVRILTDPASGADGVRTYLIAFGMEGASGVLGRKDENYRSGLDDLQVVLRQGPAYGVHLLGWWRGLRRLADDLGGSHNRDDLACLIALNVPGNELGSYLGTHDLAYTPRPNRALLIDRHDQRIRLIVPFVRPGHEPEEEVP
jgi:S-DNA-T family DNA segregation ATPase FtsK/SpoIIIE